MSTVLLIEGAITLVIGGAVGYVIRHYVAVSRRGTVEAEIEERILQAKRNARVIEDEALTRASALRDDLKKNEDRIVKQEERLDKREEELHTRDSSMTRKYEMLKQKTKELEAIKEIILTKEKTLDT